MNQELIASTFKHSELDDITATSRPEQAVTKLLVKMHDSSQCLASNSAALNSRSQLRGNVVSRYGFGSAQAWK